MSPRFALAGLLAASIALPAYAQSPIEEFRAKNPSASVRLDRSGSFLVVRDPAARAYPGEASEVAKAYVKDLGPLLSGSELGEPKVYEVGGRKLVRMEEELGGVPIYGKGVTVAVAPGGRPTLLLRSASGLAPRAAAIPSFSDEMALSKARLAVGHSAASSTRLRLVWLPLPSSPLLSYVVTSHQGFSYWRVFLDASSGEVLFSQDLVLTANGRIYETSPGEDATNPTIDALLPTFTIPPSAEDGLLSDFVNALNCDEPSDDGVCTAVGSALPDGNGDLLFEPVLSPSQSGFDNDSFAQVNMFFHVDRVHSFFQALGATDETDQILNPDGSCCTDLDTPLPSFTNVRFDNDNDGDLDDFDNAFFAGGQIVFGNGSTADFSYDADVIYHEYTHAVISFNLGGFRFDELGIDVTNGGMNEGTADIFATLFTGDPLLSEYALGPVFGRNLDNDNLYPRDLVAETHEDGKIWGGAFWAIKERMEEELGPQLGVVEVDDLIARIYIATIFSIASDADFGEAAAVAVGFASDLGAELGVGAEASQIFEEGFIERGILDAAGDPALRVVQLEPGLVSHSCDLFFGSNEGSPTFCQFLFGQASFQATSDEIIPGMIHYSVTLAPNQEFIAELQSFDFSQGDDLSLRLFIREGTPVTYRFENSIFIAEADTTVEDIATEIRITNRGAETKTLFFTIASTDRNDGGFLIQNVSFEDLLDFAGGGGCAVASGQGSPLALLALGFVLCVLRRRRR